MEPRARLMERWAWLDPTCFFFYKKKPHLLQQFSSFAETPNDIIIGHHFADAK